MAHIVLIGPIGAGKSTVAPLVAELMRREVVAVDEIRWDYYASAGFDHTEAAAISEREGPWALKRHWSPFEIDAVERITTEFADSVLDFGAGHAHYDDDPDLLDRAVSALTSHHVVLLLPVANSAESERILLDRARDDHATEQMNARFVASESFRLLADVIVYTAGRTPDEVAEEIFEWWISTTASPGTQSPPPDTSEEPVL